MLKQIRLFLIRLLPEGLKWWLMRRLSGVNDFALKFFEGIDSIWRTDPEFVPIYQNVRERSLMDMRRAYTLYQLARLSDPVPGDIAEVGMYRGASAKIMLQATSGQKQFWGFDTFSGLPAPDAKLDPYWTEHNLGDTSLDEVKAFVADPRAHLVRGIFPQTANAMPANAKFSLVHIDVDLYEAARDCCAYFYDRLSPNGMIVFDDYGFLSCPGVRKAVDEFFAGKPDKPVYLPSGQAVYFRLPARASMP